jgi:hypothetical protein
MKTYSYSDIANSYALWAEFVDPLGLDSEAEFDAKSEAEKIAFLVACFGQEQEAE